MYDLGEILKNRVKVIVNKKSNLSTKHQVKAVEFWNFVGKENDLRILLRLAKLNLKVFLKAEQHLRAALSDGIKVKDKFRYFLWLYKYYRNESKR